MMISVQVLDEQNLEGISAEWTELCNRCSRATPFQYPQWLVPWWKHFGGSTIKLLVFRAGDNLIGLVTFCIYKTEGGIKKICLAGTGITDYLDIVALPGYELQCLKATTDYLVNTAGQWDECDFQDLPEGGLLVNADFPNGFRVERQDCNVCPYLELPDSVADFQKQIPKKLRKDLHRVARELLKEGSYNIEMAGPENLVEFLNELFRLHSARWQSRNQTGVLDGEGLWKFHLESAPDMLSIGLLRLYLLRFKGKAIASYYVLAKENRAFAYLSGFDPEMENFSPGKLALLHVIEDSISRGNSVFDFLRGQETYKYYWRPKDHYNCCLRITMERK